MQLRGMIWWVDRWRKSTAYNDLTLEQQGAYRNLLDEAWLRGGALPTNDRVLAKASGDALRWPKLRAVVMKRFHRQRDGWHHDTLDRVLQHMQRRALNQQHYRERKLSPPGHMSGHHPVTKAVYPDPDPDPDPDQKQRSGSRAVRNVGVIRKN